MSCESAENELKLGKILKIANLRSTLFEHFPRFSMMDAHLHAQLVQNVSDIVFKHMHVLSGQKVMVIFDEECELSKIVLKAYREALATHPLTQFVDFNAHKMEEVEALAKTLSKDDLVVMIQSMSFRVSVYRWRLELFDHGLKVVEHVRLSHNLESEIPAYIHSLKYDFPFTSTTSQKLNELLKTSVHIKIECKGGSILTLDSRMEKPVINTGNIETEQRGGYFPIGEIFSEPIELDKMNGTVEVYAYPGEDHRMVFVEHPFKIAIENGNVVGGDFPENFQPLIDMLKMENADGKIPVREFGLGLNRGISPTHTLTEATAFERVAGLHLSMGMKHGAYQKKFKKNKELQQRYHVDIYPLVKRIWIQDTLVFDSGAFVV